MDTRTKAFQHFKTADKRFHKVVLPHIEALPKELGQRRTRAWLFARLARTIMAQQLATGAAATIRERVTAVCGGKITPGSIKRASPRPSYVLRASLGPS